MEKVLTELALYDIMAYLVPGVVVVGAALYGIAAVRRDGTHQWSWMVLVAAYLVGHALQAWASPMRHLLAEPLYQQSLKKVYTDECQTNDDGKYDCNAAFRKELQNRLNLTYPNVQTLETQFLLAESFLQGRQLDGFVQIMQARYGFFRGLFVGFPIAALILSFVLWFQYKDRRAHQTEQLATAVLIVLCLLGAVTAGVRTGDFDKYYTQAVYEAFYNEFSPSTRADGVK